MEKANEFHELFKKLMSWLEEMEGEVFKLNPETGGLSSNDAGNEV